MVKLNKTFSLTVLSFLVNKIFIEELKVSNFLVHIYIS